MKTQLGILFSLLTLIAVTGCSKEVEVSGDLMDGVSIPQGNTGKVDVSGKTFENSYGQIRFAQVDQNQVQVFRTCSFSQSSCETLGADVSSSYQLKLNDSTSVHSRTLSTLTAATRATGSMTALVLNTELRTAGGRLYKTLSESFSISENPCDSNEGKGLQVIRTESQPINGGSVDTETCIAYF